MNRKSVEFDELFSENDRTRPEASSRQFLRTGSFLTKSGKLLAEVTIAFETFGSLNRDKSNAILVCHALSGDSHCIGWWNHLVGPGKSIDTNKFFVICSNTLGGCQGTTGPSSLAPDGKPYLTRFPLITIEDMVAIQERLIRHLGIQRLYAVCGGSMGGMQALEWSVQFPGMVSKAFITASAASHSSMQIGFNEAGRQAIMRDPAWNGGDYEGDGPVGGLAVARMIGHLTFLSETSFDRKFGRRYQGKPRPDYTLGVEFEVESYLQHQGNKFTGRFDANSYLILTRAIDYYQLDSLEAAKAKFLIVSFTSDWIYPSHQSETLHGMAKKAGLDSIHLEFDLPFGHDSFLLDGELQGQALQSFLAPGSISD